MVRVGGGGWRGLVASRPVILPPLAAARDRRCWPHTPSCFRRRARSLSHTAAGFTAASIVLVCIYGVFYFAVCLRMVRDELRAIAAFTMGFCMGLTGRGRIQNEVLTEALTEEVSTSTKP